MRGLVLVCVLAACNDPGLLLEVHASDGAAMASVEVMIPDDVHGGGMGMPPQQSGKTGGKVYEVIETTQADVSDGTAKVLLQAGSIDAVPALLVLGKDASGGVTGYALITDPNSSDGLIHVRHTASDEIVVHLDPIAEVPIAQLHQSADADRLVRWDKQGDAGDGRCIGIIHGSGKGDFFGPEGDRDCDAADPECDDTWFLKNEGPGVCPTQTPPPNDDTMDACRIGSTLGCTDNVTEGTDCTTTPSSVCTSLAVCTQCSDLDPDCITSLASDQHATHVECTIDILDDASAPAMCANTGDRALIDMNGIIGPNSLCAGVPGLITDVSNVGTPMPTVPLLSSTAMLTFTCAEQGMQGINVTLMGASDHIDPTKMETPGVLVFRVNGDGSAVTGHVLALPFRAYYEPVTGNECPTTTPAIRCTLVDGLDGSGNADPLWNCAGS